MINLLQLLSSLYRLDSNAHGGGIILSVRENILSKYFKKTDFDSDLPKYENVILLLDFNVEPTKDAMEEFMKVYNLKILLKGSICFRNPDKRTCISLILINKSKSFQAIQIIETGISDFHRMVMTVLKVYFKKKGPSVIQYCDYKIFSNEKRRNDLFNKLIDLNLKPRGLIFLLIQY